MSTLKKTGKDQFSVGVDYLLFSNPKRHRADKEFYESREFSWRRHLSFLNECPFAWVKTSPPQTCLGPAVKWELHCEFHCF